MNQNILLTDMPPSYQQVQMMDDVSDWAYHQEYIKAAKRIEAWDIAPKEHQSVKGLSVEVSESLYRFFDKGVI